MSDDSTKKIDVSEKVSKGLEKSHKKIKIIISVVIGVIVVLGSISIMSVTEELSQPKKIGLEDFPLELFAENYGVVCLRDATFPLPCLIANNGIIKFEHKDGIYSFQTSDFSLIKYFSSATGTEEKSISYAYYDVYSEVKIMPYGDNREAFWLVTEKGK